MGKVKFPVRLMPPLEKDYSETKSMSTEEKIKKLEILLNPELEKPCKCGNHFNHTGNLGDWAKYPAFRLSCSNPSCDEKGLLVIYSVYPLKYEITFFKKPKTSY